MLNMTMIPAFIAACTVIILIPGPAQALVLSNSIGHGKKCGVTTAIGLNTATVFHAIAAGLGLSAILAVSSVAFSIVKYAGAVYLLYIGIKTFRSSGEINLSLKDKSKSNVFLKAFITGVLNPKCAIFFFAFLPHFIDKKNGYVFLQFITLGIMLALLDTFYELILVAIIARSRRYFENNRRFIKIRQKITGAVLIGLGLRLAIMERE